MDPPTRTRPPSTKPGLVTAFRQPALHEQLINAAFHLIRQPESGRPAEYEAGQAAQWFRPRSQYLDVAYGRRDQLAGFIPGRFDAVQCGIGRLFDLLILPAVLPNCSLLEVTSRISSTI